MRFGPVWDIDNSKALSAATAGANFVQDVDISNLVYIDPIMGVCPVCLQLAHTELTSVCLIKMLWALLGQTLVNALTTLKQNTTFTLSPSVAVSPGEIIVTSSLNCILNAMNYLRETCPLIGMSIIRFSYLRVSAHRGYAYDLQPTKLRNFIT